MRSSISRIISRRVSALIRGFIFWYLFYGLFIRKAGRLARLRAAVWVVARSVRPDMGYCTSSSVMTIVCLLQLLPEAEVPLSTGRTTETRPVNVISLFITFIFYRILETLRHRSIRAT